MLMLLILNELSHSFDATQVAENQLNWTEICTLQLQIMVPTTYWFLDFFVGPPAPRLLIF